MASGFLSPTLDKGYVPPVCLGGQRGGALGLDRARGLVSLASLWPCSFFFKVSLFCSRQEVGTPIATSPAHHIPAGHVSFDTNPSRTGADLASGRPATLAMLPLLAELVSLSVGQESFAIFVLIFIAHFSSTVITVPRGDSQNTCQPVSTAPASIPTAAWRTRHLSLSTLLLGPPLRQFWVE